MTVSFAIKCSDGGIVLAGDSFCGDDSISDHCADPKVYAVGPLGVCLAGGIRPEQVLHKTAEALVSNRQKKGKGISAKWVQNAFIDRLRENLQAYGSLESRNGINIMSNCSFLFCIEGRILNMDEDFSIWESVYPYSAIGMGRELAYGALSALVDCANLPTPEHAIEIAHKVLGICSTWSPWVCSPYTVIRLR